jgi:uncharacterized protein (DUF302 family)
MATTNTTNGYGYSRSVEMSFDDAVERTKAALKEQGFGVLAEIDIRAAMKEKLGLDVAPHLILGACNPQLAHRALEAEPEISLLLPCNVVVRERDGRVQIAAIDAERMMSFVGNPALEPIAREANERLRKAVDAV